MFKTKVSAGTVSMPGNRHWKTSALNTVNTHNPSLPLLTGTLSLMELL
uniref:Uncharacterized protein n=1 Tax=Anguilla anguilla TaxID=7936 RepID=A0A0E9S8W7_ANGAN